MRLFEALTIAFAGQVVLAVAVMGAARPRWMNLMPLAVLAPLAAHLVLEGPRWQMAPAYVVAIIACILGIRRRRLDAAARGGALSRLAGLGGIALLAASVILALAVPL